MAKCQFHIFPCLPGFFSHGQGNSRKIIDPEGFQGGKPRLKVFTVLDVVCPKSGPYEASEGIYPGRAKKKTEGGQGHFSDLVLERVDRVPGFDYLENDGSWVHARVMMPVL
jgi:hypothetical protein